MAFLKQIFFNCAAAVPINLLKVASGIRVVLPYHHLVADDEVLHVKHLYTYKNRQQFKQELEYLLKHYQPLTASEACSLYFQQTTAKKKGFLLTFDDGLREIADEIAPLLEHYGIPALFFINPAFVDNRELFYRFKISIAIEQVLKKNYSATVLQQLCLALHCPNAEKSTLKKALRNIHYNNKQLIDEAGRLLEIDFDDYLHKTKPFLTRQQLHNLKAKGFEIGAHSMDHPDYALLSPEDQVQQTKNSITFVQDHFQPSMRYFSFPHEDNHISKTFFAQTHTTTVDYFFGIQNQKKENGLPVLQRFNAELTDTDFVSKLKSVLLYSALTRFLPGTGVKRQ
jgi:peptidoglycan/xylan/chitin deacetylase (PgdA/CDA1 family)